ncbi:hypothetical protein KR059_004018, partial [Drosophila kikkawai]
MPRRRRSRRKLNPSIALRKKNQESAGHSSRSKSEPPLPPTVPDSPKAEPPKSEPPSEEVTGEAASTSSGEVGNEAEYKLFPEVFEKPPLGLLPTFADVFGQPSYENGYQPKDVPPAAAPTSSSSSTSTFASTSQGCGCPGIQSTADGHFTQIPATMLNDSFGMTGLLAAIRSTVTEPGSTQLIFGEDLTTYGLDLAAQGDIYVHFNGPFTMEPPERSSMDCALELGMRAMRDAMDRYPPLPPFWDPFVPETRNLGLLGVDGKKLASDQGQEPKMATKSESKSEPKTEPVKESKEDPPLPPPERSRDRER